jgi:hypothetical protein
MRDLESTDLASAERLERERALRDEFEIADDGHPTGLPLGFRAAAERGFLPGVDSPEDEPDSCEIGEHHEDEDGWCLACGEWVRPYPEDF